MKAIHLLPALIVVLAVPAAGSAFIVTHRINSENQANMGVEFELAVENKRGVANVKLEVPRRGEFVTLSTVRFIVKDSKGDEVVAAPIATTDDKGLTRAEFRLAIEHARHCTIILETEADPSRGFAINYLVDLKSYLEPQAPAGPLLADPNAPTAGPVKAPALQDGWAKLKGRIVWDGAVTVQPKIDPGVDKKVCAQDKRPLDEEYIVDAKNGGLKNVFVWIQPAVQQKGVPFPQKLINPALLKPAVPIVSIDTPCCRIVPHVLAAREGQRMVFKNSGPIAHNVKWDSDKNSSLHPRIEVGGQYTFKNPLVAEPGEITLSCSIHGWMKAHVRVFDHPYFAVTDADGNFEINNAPVGKFNLFIHHPATGWLNGKAGRNGTPIDIKPGGQNLGTFKMKTP
jgi:hypothetical protein